MKGLRKYLGFKVPRWLVVVAILLAVGYASHGIASAIVASWKTVTGTCVANYVDETRAVSYVPQGNDRYMVRFQPQPIALPDTNYTATLYFDGVPVSVVPGISWTAQQIAAGTIRVVVFTGLTFGSESCIVAEATR